MNLFTSQQRGQVPVAPTWSQQTAANWEPSVTTVGNLGGHTIKELQEAIQTKWPFLFRIQKVWRARDAISDNRYQVQSYLEHHWVILKLVPCYKLGGGEQEPKPEADDGSPNVALAINTILEAGAEPEDLTSNGKRAAPELNSPRAKKAAGEEGGVLDRLDEAGLAEEESLEAGSNPLDHSAVGVAEEAGEKAASGAGLTTGAQLSAEQESLLKPREDLEAANQGKTWFLRIDRFNEGDKWFACTTFENALLSEQARDKHYSPRSEVTFEAVKGRPPLHLDCLVPSLARLGAVPYSVFAKGNHCQWHARVVTTLCATLCSFIDPEGVRKEFSHKVSAILVDGKEQQRYTVSGKKKQEKAVKPPEQSGTSPSVPEDKEASKTAPESGEGGLALEYPKAYLLSFPEAPYLKPALLDVKELARSHPDKVPASVTKKNFPDMRLIYSAICT